MAPLSLEQSLEISKLCQVMISLDPGIHAVTVVNKNGRILNSILRDDSTTKNLTPQESEMLFMQRVLQTSMNREFDTKLGLFHCTVSYRDKMIELIFPLLNGIIFVGADPKTPAQELIKNISKEINDYKFNLEHKIASEKMKENAVGETVSITG
jgi:hypothetical protein